MNKLSKFIAALSLSALATTGCKSQEPAPAQGADAAAGDGTTQQQSTGTDASCGADHACAAGR